MCYRNSCNGTQKSWAASQRFNPPRTAPHHLVKEISQRWPLTWGEALLHLAHSCTDRRALCVTLGQTDPFFSQKLQKSNFFKTCFICVKTGITVRPGTKIRSWTQSTFNWNLILIFLFLEKKPWTNTTSETSKLLTLKW